MSKPGPRAETEAQRFAAVLRAKREALVGRWERYVREDPAVPEARWLSEAQLRDHIPALVDRLAEALERAPVAAGAALAPAGAPPGGPALAAHAEERVREHYDLPAALRELFRLRVAVLELCREEGLAPGSEAAARVHVAVDEWAAALAVRIGRHEQAQRAHALAALEHGDACFVLDRDWNFVLANEAHVRLSRIPRERLLGRNFWEVFPVAADPRSQYWVEYHRCVGQRAAVSFEDYYAPEGRWVSVTAYPTDEGGIAVFYRDVTERRHADAERERLHEQLAAERARLAAVIHQLPYGVLLAEAPSGKILLGNEALARIVRHGVRESPDIAHYGDWKGFHRDGRPYAPEEWPLARALQKGETVAQEEIVYERGDGTRCTVEVSATPVRDRAGAVIAGVVIVQDVTDARELVRQRDATLALLDTFMASAPIGFAVIDREFRYVRINEALARDNGAPVAAHLGRQVRDVVPTVWPQVEVLLRQVFETEQPIVGLEVGFAAPAHPGEERSYLLSFYPIRDGAGTTMAVGVIAVDITGQKHAEAELRREAAFRERFLGIVGHDLRNPLASIRLTTDTLLRQGGLAERLAQGLARVARSARRMDEMINQLLDFTRSRSGGGIAVDRRPGDLAEVVRQAVEELEAAHPERRIERRIQGDATGRWDLARLAQVASNLVSNALAYSPADTPVLVALEGREDLVALQVHNRGAPIPPDVLKSVFDPLRRGEARENGGVRRPDGLGLGLYIAAQIVKAHGGTIELRSTARDGTTATVRLPRR